MTILSLTAAQVDEKLADVYGGMHTHQNSTAQSIPNGAGYTKIINWMDNDPAVNTTPDAASGEITADVAGKFSVDGSFSFSAANNKTFFISLFIDGVEQESVHLTRKIGTAGDVGNAGFSGIVSLAAGQVLDVRARHDDTSPVNITMQYMNLNLTKVGLA